MRCGARLALAVPTWWLHRRGACRHRRVFKVSSCRAACAQVGGSILTHRIEGGSRVAGRVACCPDVA